MANILDELKNLLSPPAPIFRVKVLSRNMDEGTSLVQFPGNGPSLTVRGVSVAPASYAFIQSGEIRQQAPALDEITIDV